MVTVSQFAAPRGGEASLWSACGSSPLGLPGAYESGGSFAVRTPQGRRGLILICVWHHSARWTSQEPTELATVSQRQTPGAATPHSDLRIKLLRWASEEPTKVATVSQFAAPKDGEDSF